MYTPHPLAIQTAYQDLLDRHRRRPQVSIEGSLITEVRAAQLYWVARRRIGGRVHATHIGPDNPETKHRVEIAKAEQQAFETWRNATAALVAQLRAAGASTLDMQTGKIIAALARVGFFSAGGILAGTHAYALYEMELGVRFQGAAARTEDIDLMATPSVKLAIEGKGGLPGLLGDLGLKPVVSIGEPHPHSWTSPEGTPVDILTPLRRGGKPIVPLKGLGLHAQALPFLEFMFAEPIQAVGLYREGSLVNIPAPQRYAIHKLIVAAERKGSFRTKSEKDLDQVGMLVAVLGEQRPYELKSAYLDAMGRGPKWKKAIKQSLERRPDIADALSQL